MKNALRLLLLALLLIAIAFPVFYMISTSFFSPADYRAEVSRFLPSKFSFDNYRIAFGQRYFSNYLVNSIATSLLTAFGRTMIVIMVAFAFSHLEFTGKKPLLIILLATLFVPQDALIYQNYSTVASLGLIDTYAAIVLPGLFSASQLILLYSAFSSLSRDYYDAGRIDGAKDICYIFRILIPLTQSIVITIILQSAVTAFNSYLWPLLVTNRPKARTIQIALSMMGFREEGKLGAEAASIVIVTTPFLVLLALGRKKINEALLKGGLSE